MRVYTDHNIIGRYLYYYTTYVWLRLRDVTVVVNRASRLITILLNHVSWYLRYFK